MVAFFSLDILRCNDLVEGFFHFASGPVYSRNKEIFDSEFHSSQLNYIVFMDRIVLQISIVSYHFTI